MSAEISEVALEQIAKDKRVSPGELAALKLALKKRKSKDIAKSLEISESAARKRLGEVYRKFEIKGRGPGKLASLMQKIVEQASDPDTRYSLVGQSASPLFDSSFAAAASAAKPSSPDADRTIYHWGMAPKIDWFQGRCEPIRALSNWILEPAQSTRLLAICGIGGIGKTCLSVKIAEAVGSHFQQVVWLSMDEDRSPEDFLRSLLMTLQLNASSKIRLHSTKQSPNRSAAKTFSQPSEKVSNRTKRDRTSENTAPRVQATATKLIQQLVLHLSQQRCLVILDGFEAVFRSEQTVGERAPTFSVSRRQQASAYKEGFEAYGQLLDAIKTSPNSGARASMSHSSISSLEQQNSPRPSSCLMLTSREKPREFLSAASKEAVKLYPLSGLSDADAKAVIEKFCLQGTIADYRRFAKRYSGHPMALLLAADTIQDVFSGSIREFLEQDVSVFDDLRSVLKAQFKRLPLVEKSAMFWLAVNQKPCLLEELKADIVSRDQKANLVYTLRSLEQRSLIEVTQSKGGNSVLYQLHPIVLEYMLDRFVREMFCDLVRGDLSTFNSFALLKADAEDNLREVQRRRIVLPILERLNNHFRKFGEVEKYLGDRLETFRINYPYRLGYAGGNFINLLVELSAGDLSKKDFSELVIWQAYLPGVRLSESNFNSCQLDRSVFTEALGDVLAVDFRAITSRDGGNQEPLLAAGDANGVVHLWTTEGEQTNAIGASGFMAKSQTKTSLTLSHKLAQWTAHSGWVRSLSFVPNRDYLVTGGDDNKVKLWWLPLDDGVGRGANNAKLVWENPTYDWIHAIAVSPDGDLLACGDGDKISLYQIPNGKPVHQIANAAVRTLAFSPDGQWLAGCGEDATIRLWSTSDIKAAKANMQPELVLKGHQKAVHTVKFSPDSRLLVSGGNDRKIVVWEITSAGRLMGREKHRFARMSDRTRTLAVSPDGRFLASGGDDAQVRVWDLETYKLLQEIPTDRARLWSVKFHQQGEKLLLAAGGDKQRLILWQTALNNSFPTDKAENSYIKDSHIKDRSLDDGHWVEAASATALPKFKSLRTYRGYTRGIRSLAYLGNRGIIGGGDSGDLSVWNAKTGEPTATLSLHNGRIWAVAVDAQEKRIASASDDYTVRLWSAQTGQCLTTLSGHSSWVRALSFSHHGRYLASAGDDCQIRIWNTISGICSAVLDRSENWIHSVSFDPTNGRYLISGGDAQVVRHWRRKENQFESLARHDHRICSVTYNCDGSLIASGSDDATAIVWDVKRREILHHFKQPSLGIKAVSFSPDGRYLAAGGEDQIVFVWDLTADNPNERCLKLRPNDYTGLAGTIRSVVFSPCSKWIISGGLDEMVRWGDLSQMERLSKDDEGFLVPLIERDRPYENLKIQNVKGLSHSQVANLLSLGAVNSRESLLL